MTVGRRYLSKYDIYATREGIDCTHGHLAHRSKYSNGLPKFPKVVAVTTEEVRKDVQAPDVTSVLTTHYGTHTFIWKGEGCMGGKIITYPDPEALVVAEKVKGVTSTTAGWMLYSSPAGCESRALGILLSSLHWFGLQEKGRGLKHLFHEDIGALTVFKTGQEDLQTALCVRSGRFNVSSKS